MHNIFCTHRKRHPGDIAAPSKNKRHKADNYSWDEKAVRLKDVLGEDQMSFCSDSAEYAIYSPPCLSEIDKNYAKEEPMFEVRRQLKPYDNGNALPVPQDNVKKEGEG